MALDEDLDAALDEAPDEVLDGALDEVPDAVLVLGVVLGVVLDEAYPSGDVVSHQSHRQGGLRKIDQKVLSNRRAGASVEQ